MKNIVILTASFLLLISVSAFSQKNLPENVKKEFSKKYATAKSVKWNNEEKNEWEAEFTTGNKRMSASFDDSGKWLESETKITEKELPPEVTETLNKDFQNYKKSHIEYFESPAIKGFEIGLKKGDTTLEVVIDNAGNVIKKTTEK